MAIATNAMKENLAIAYGQSAAYASLHTADPGTTGANEVSGGLYARKALVWTAGSTDGVVTVTVTFDAPNGTLASHVGLWTAASGGTFLDKASATATSNGQIQATFTYTQS